MNCFRKYLLFLVLLVFQFKFHSQTLKHYSSLLDRTDISGFESTRTFDKNGVILSKKKYHPLSVAVYGVLSYYNFKESNDSSYYFKSVNQVKYFKDSTKVNFLFNGKGIGLPYKVNFWDLKAPWYSGMTQGYAISYLLRYYELTKDDLVIPIIQKIAYTLIQKQELGGTISKTKEGYTWIEEYPNSKKSPQVINGYINGLIGLKEYVDFFPNDTLAVRIFNETYHGVVNSLEYFDSPTWSYYNRAKKSLSNKYLRYQIYEMKHLYEIFNDEIFDNQMRIWSVLSHNKFIKSKPKHLKYPYHNISIPTKKIANNRYGTILNDKTLVIKSDSLKLNKTYSSSKKFKKSFKNTTASKFRKSPKYTFLSFLDNNSISSNYVDITHAKINENINIQVFHVDEKMKIKPIDFSYYVIAGKISLTFIESDLRDLVFRIEQFYPVDSLQFQLDFHNSNIVKPPFFKFYKSKKIQLTKGQLYSVDLGVYNTDKVKIFFKGGASEAEFRKSKWKAKNYISESFVPDLDGLYQFMIVFDYQSPLSMIGEFSLQ
ncbi:MAG: D-glucuronyl C5-epimerase family protein [Flavobacteriales bacterium]|jgi:heparosan-N-sulfate-glucuronate 5-epimerase|nr:D-glucuronyl C5-epimerase family protein [Flavobacteriales bacterium]